MNFLIENKHKQNNVMLFINGRFVQLRELITTTTTTTKITIIIMIVIIINSHWRLVMPALTYINLVDKTIYTHPSV